LKRIVFSDDAKADIRAIQQQLAMNILGAIVVWPKRAQAASRLFKVRPARSASALAISECASPKKAAILCAFMP